MPSDKLCIAVRQLRAITETSAPEGRSDGQLLRDFVARRDETAFEVLVRRHGPMVLGVCRRVLRHFQDAEDAFQGTFVVLARKSATLGQREIVGNWLHGVAYRTALKARATAATRRARERTMAKPEFTAHEEDQEALAQLDREINLLPAAQRAVVVLCDLEGKTYKEAARLLGCAEGTVGSRLARAHEVLAKRLGRRDSTLAGSGLAGLVPQLVPSPVPSTLITATVQAATGTASAAALGLANAVVRGLLLAKLKTVGVLLVGIGVIGLALECFIARLPGKGPTRRHRLARRRCAQVVSRRIPKRQCQQLIRISCRHLGEISSTIRCPRGRLLGWEHWLSDRAAARGKARWLSRLTVNISFPWVAAGFGAGTSPPVRPPPTLGRA